MRVTNSMLVNNFMRNLNSNLVRMDGLQNQLATGRKFAHISDDPSALIYSQASRNSLARLSHYQRTVESAHDRLVQTEAGLMELQLLVVNAYEATIDAATDVKADGDKVNISVTMGQYRDHFVNTLNMTFGDKFLFGGYNTPGEPSASMGTDMITGPFTVENDASGRPQLIFNGFNLSQFDRMTVTEWEDIKAFDLSYYELIPGIPASAVDLSSLTINDITDAAFDFMALGLTSAEWDAVKADGDVVAKLSMDMFDTLRSDVLTFDVGPAVSMEVTMSGLDMIFYRTVDETGTDVIRNIFNVMDDVYQAANDGSPAEVINKYIKPLQDAQNHLLTQVAEVGGRVRRLELLTARYEQDFLNYERMKSDAEDVDFADVIMYQKMAEAVYQASLSTGARIIQPTLMDFLR